MKKIAIPISKGILTEYIKDINHFEIFVIDDNIIVGNDIEIPPKMNVKKLIDWLYQKNVTDLIIHKTNNLIIRSLSERKINLYIGIATKEPEILINDYLNGILSSDEDIINQIISDK